MRLISQNKQFDIQYEQCNLAGNPKTNEIEAYVTEKFEPVMGRYENAEQCKKVLEMIQECYNMNLLFGQGIGNARDLCCDYVADQKLGIFEMPQINEIKIQEEVNETDM